MRKAFQLTLLGALLGLSGCTGNDIVHACPDVRYENPSLLQGRTVQTLWNEQGPGGGPPCDAPPLAQAKR